MHARARYHEVCPTGFFFEKGDCLPHEIVELRQYSPVSTPWFVGFHLREDLMKLLLKNGTYLPKKMEKCRFKNGCMQAWELALSGR